MSLKGLKGRRPGVNERLFCLALNSTPAIMVDPGNSANVHSLHDTPIPNLQNLFVVPAESLYRFKPTLLSLPQMSSRLGTGRIFISTFTKLFNYDDEDENRDIFRFAWTVIKRISLRFEVTVAVEEGTLHEQIAEKCGIEWVKDMGHTVWSQRIVTDIMLGELKKFAAALDARDRETYLRLLKEPLKHLGSISNAASSHTWAFLLLSTIVEQQKRIERLEDEVGRLAD
jgi:hypothetical protein